MTVDKRLRHVRKYFVWKEKEGNKKRKKEREKERRNKIAENSSALSSLFTVRYCVLIWSRAISSTYQVMRFLADSDSVKVETKIKIAKTAALMERWRAQYFFSILNLVFFFAKS